MNKKIVLILAGIALLFIVGAIFFLLTFNKPAVKTPPPSSFPDTTPTRVDTSSGKINISGIKTNNFLLNPIRSNSRGDVVFVKTSEYQITYLKIFSEFIVNISTSSATAREGAELEFLTKLGITKEDACKLKISISAPYAPGQNPALQKRALSFCPAKQQEY